MQHQHWHYFSFNPATLLFLMNVSFHALVFYKLYHSDGEGGFPVPSDNQPQSNWKEIPLPTFHLHVFTNIIKRFPLHQLQAPQSYQDRFWNKFKLNAVLLAPWHNDRALGDCAHLSLKCRWILWRLLYMNAVSLHYTVYNVSSMGSSKMNITKNKHI